MGFTVFVSIITNDGDRFPRAIVEDAFAPFTDDPSSDYWNLRTPAGESVFASVSIRKENPLTGFSVDRPTHYDYFPELWDALYEVMRQTRTILYWPTNTGRYCIADRGLAADMPADFAADWPDQTLVSSGADIQNAILTDG